MSESKNRSKLWYSVVALFLAIGIVVGFLLPVSPGQFPVIAPGMYVGTVTGIGTDPNAVHVLYVERLPESNVFVIVPFLEGTRPQAVAAEAVRSDVREDASFAPLAFAIDNRTFHLQGEIHGDSVRGELFEDSRRIGSWELRPRAESEVVYASPVGPELKSLQDWLSSKSDQRKLRREVRVLESELRLEQDKRKKLEGFVRDEKLLQRRASERRDELAEELRVAVDERKRITTQLTGLLKDLDTLGSITRTGQAVTLARRVAHRENQWYVAHWDEEGSNLPVLDEEGATSIDPQKLEQQVQKAAEVQAMLHELANERERNSQLKKRLVAGRSDPLADPEAPQPEQMPTAAPSAVEIQPTQPATEKGLWDRLF